MIYDLLDAHVFLKCNDWNATVDSMSKFLMNSYATIKLKFFTQIVEEAFTRAIFAHSIYQNSSSAEGGTLINLESIWYLNYSKEELRMQEQKKT